MEDKEGTTIADRFQGILNNSEIKPKKYGLIEAMNSVIGLKKWLDDHDIKKYLTNNTGKSVVAERFIKTSKRKIFIHFLKKLCQKTFILRCIDNR